VHHRESILVSAPLNEVWELVGQTDAWSRWAGVNDVRVEGVLREGARVSYRAGKRETTATVSEYRDGRLLAIHVSQRSYELDESISIVGMNGSTEVSIAMRFRPTVWWTAVLGLVLTPFDGLLLGRPLRKSLEALRRAAESARRER
jgi:uncharacterized protein YndB with AHSA1/START domain